MCLLGGALAWLWWQLLSQDRQLETQRVQERLELAADRVAAALATKSREFDRWLPLASNGTAQTPPEGVTLLLNTGHGVTVQPPGRLLYLPPSPTSSRPDGIFDEGERSEFQGHDPARAAEYFRTLLTSLNPEVRAGALLRLARNLRKSGLNREAFVAYGQMLLIKDVAIEGIPVELLALDARGAVLESMGRDVELRKEAELMDSGLRDCRWSLPGPAWDFYRQEASRWVHTGPLTEAERQALALSRAAEWVCQLGPRFPEPKGHRILAEDNGPVLISWSAAADRLVAVLVAPQELQAIWKQSQIGAGVHAALVDAEGRAFLGAFTKDTRRAVRSPADTGLPATLLVTPSDPAADAANSAIHRRFLLVGFAVLGLVLTAGSYFILHSIARERALGQLQTEFVSAVSHEFRTPLTSLRHLSEMLEHDRIPGEAERRQAYGVMYHATVRLQRLVESLLDFGRMEAVAFRYRFDEVVDVGALVEHVAAEFRGQATSGHAIDLRQAEHLPTIRADREALGVAVWNLLDNAVKYSPQSPTVWVETQIEGPRVAIVVRDRGLGIETSEQDRVFDRFVRGSAAQHSNIKGTGIGLSMARHIVRAHGGDIRLGSEPGKGSTFTIVLPVERQL